MVDEPKKLRLAFYQCPGDTLVATGAVECLMQQFPGRFLLDVEGTDAGPIFENNPFVRRLDGPDVQVVRMENPLINDCDKRPVHFLQTYTDHLGKTLGIDLHCKVNRPFVYLSDEEKAWTNQVEEMTGRPTKFWVVCSGVKGDYTVKGWGHDAYQAVVHQLRGVVQFVQVGRPEHGHRTLEGAIDLRGKTDTRQLIRLVHHAQGCLSGESFLHHLAAAHQKPAVCLASGFLPKTWIEYPTTTVLTKAAMMPCCDRSKGCCWKARVVKLGDGDGKNGSLCELPVYGGSEPVPKCLALIRPEEVVGAIRAYYEGGLLTY